MSIPELVNALPMPAAVFDSQNVVLAANAAFAGWVSMPVAALVGRPFPLTADWERLLLPVRGTATSGHVSTDGQSAQARVAPAGPNRLVTLELSVALSGVVEAFARFAAAAPFAAWVRDEAGRYTYANAHYPTAGVVGRTLAQVWPAGVAERYAADDRRVLDGKLLDVVDTLDDSDCGSQVWHLVKFPLDANDGRRWAGGVGLNVTARRRAEEGRREAERVLNQAQKTESLGLMAGGVAHDFNNLLTAILGNAGLARLHVPPSGPAADCLRKVEEAAGAAAGRCRQMLAYAGRGPLAVGRVDVAAVVRQMAPVLRTLVPATVELEIATDDHAPDVKGDAAQIQQLVLNLVTNAADAVGENGRIRVSARGFDACRQHLDSCPATRHLAPGLYAQIKVSDTGGGVDEGTLARIFDPFFTTKFAGRGLGLSVVQGVARGHKGAVSVSSRLGRGTKFRVLLPASGSVVMGAKSGRGRTVLVIDDEEEVRVVVRKLLESVGFTVLVAVDGRDGVDTFRRYPGQVAAVLLDLAMPRLDGAAALTELRVARHDVPVVICTGRNTPLPDGPDRPTAVVRKPFTAPELHAALFAAVGE